MTERLDELRTILDKALRISSYHIGNLLKVVLVNICEQNKRKLSYYGVNDDRFFEDPGKMINFIFHKIGRQSVFVDGEYHFKKDRGLCFLKSQETYFHDIRNFRNTLYHQSQMAVDSIDVVLCQLRKTMYTVHKNERIEDDLRSIIGFKQYLLKKMWGNVDDLKVSQSDVHVTKLIKNNKLLKDENIKLKKIMKVFVEELARLGIRA